MGILISMSAAIAAMVNLIIRRTIKMGVKKMSAETIKRHKRSIFDVITNGDKLTMRHIISRQADKRRSTVTVLSSPNSIHSFVKKHMKDDMVEIGSTKHGKLFEVINDKLHDA